jgi:uncharacterized membrane protein
MILLIYLIGCIIAYFPIRAYAVMWKRNNTKDKFSRDDRTFVLAFCVMSWLAVFLFLFKFMEEANRE